MHDGNPAHARTAGQSRPATDGRSVLPDVVSPDELVKEKHATRALDALVAGRRRLPVVEFSAEYGFDGPHGSVDLLGLFAGRRQLVVYHFMFEPSDEHVCDLNVLDLTPLGRQEDWEDSPPGWPQTAASWWRLHDEYVSQNVPAAS